jgi:hypothetical protein
MSQENVRLNYRAIDAFNRRDLGAYLSLQDPEVEFIPYEVKVQGGDPYRGHAGVRTWWEESFAVLPDLRAEVYEIRDLGDRTFARRSSNALSGIRVVLRGCARLFGGRKGAKLRYEAVPDTYEPANLE